MHQHLTVTPEQYRSHYLDSDRAQWRFALVLFAVPNLGFISFDYALFGFSTMFYVFIGLRLLHVSYSAWLWFFLPRLDNATIAYRYMAVWCHLGVAIILINALGRPAAYFGHYVFEVYAMLVLFAAVPLPPKLQLSAALTYLPFSLYILFAYKAPPLALYTGNVVFVLVLTVVSGYLISTRIQRYRMSALAARIELEAQARTDPLTGIANRRAFMDWVQVELARHDRSGTTLSVLMLDIDHFKAINDRYGHSAGDLLLTEFAQRIAIGLRAYDQFARMGGEEFVIVLPDCTMEEAATIAERLRESVAARPFAAKEEQVPMTMSVGVTRLLDGETSIDGALRRADTALYQAKDAGRNRIGLIG